MLQCLFQDLCSQNSAAVQNTVECLSESLQPGSLGTSETSRSLSSGGTLGTSRTPRTSQTPPQTFRDLTPLLDTPYKRSFEKGEFQRYIQDN
ncbi:unnamed protein product [Rhizophagus irregularis]|nr:unnamed protein product [Rhizophagus irregularis]CAB5294582.1 unnamed protein product [Rhizophagus irregularis]